MESPLSKKMKDDWDLRVKQDYRLWMSDGVKDDRAMWESGARDFDIIVNGIPTGPDKTALEIGCGVGRLLKYASNHFGKAIGIDVSEEAILKAQQLLTGIDSIRLLVTSGVGLELISDSAVDFVYSFASITSMPKEVIARYLCESRRVIKPAGVVRFQVYVGEEQPVSENDTLSVRCFKEEQLKKACDLAGFSITGLEELVLPFQTSFAGITTKILTLKPDGSPKSPIEVCDALSSLKTECIAPTEFLMSYNHAKSMLACGDLDRAETALSHSIHAAKIASLDVGEWLEALSKEIRQARDLS